MKRFLVMVLFVLMAGCSRDAKDVVLAAHNAATERDIDELRKVTDTESIWKDQEKELEEALLTGKVHTGKIELFRGIVPETISVTEFSGGISEVHALSRLYYCDGRTEKITLYTKERKCSCFGPREYDRVVMIDADRYFSEADDCLTSWYTNEIMKSQKKFIDGRLVIEKSDNSTLTVKDFRKDVVEVRVRFMHEAVLKTAVEAYLDACLSPSGNFKSYEDSAEDCFDNVIPSSAAERNIIRITHGESGTVDVKYGPDLTFPKGNTYLIVTQITLDNGETVKWKLPELN